MRSLAFAAAVALAAIPRLAPAQIEGGGKVGKVELDGKAYRLNAAFAKQYPAKNNRLDIFFFPHALKAEDKAELASPAATAAPRDSLRKTAFNSDNPFPSGVLIVGLDKKPEGDLLPSVKLVKILMLLNDEEDGVLVKDIPREAAAKFFKKLSFQTGDTPELEVVIDTIRLTSEAGNPILHFNAKMPVADEGATFSAAAAAAAAPPPPAKAAAAPEDGKEKAAPPPDNGVTTF